LYIILWINNHIYSLKMSRWIYWRNIGLCSSCRSLYRLLNYIGWKPEELSPVLYINLSVAKNFPFYVQDIWKVRSCKTCISTLLTINLQTKTHHTHPKLLKLFLHVKRDTDCCGFAFFFRGLASGELKVTSYLHGCQWMSSTWRKRRWWIGEVELPLKWFALA